MAFSILRDLLTPRNGMTIGELMTIDQGRQEKAFGCNVSLQNIYHEIQKETILDKFKSFFFGKPFLPIYYVIFKLKVSSGSGREYDVIIRANPDFNLKDWQNNKIQIYCSCPDFEYRSAYTLNKKGALFLTDRIRTTLGESVIKPPKSTTKISFLCKHSYAALMWLINNYYTLMKNI